MRHIWSKNEIGYYCNNTKIANTWTNTNLDRSRKWHDASKNIKYFSRFAWLSKVDGIYRELCLVRKCPLLCSFLLICNDFDQYVEINHTTVIVLNCRARSKLFDVGVIFSWIWKKYWCVALWWSICDHLEN